MSVRAAVPIFWLSQFCFTGWNSEIRNKLRPQNPFVCTSQKLPVNPEYIVMEHGFNFAGGKTFPAHFIGQKLHAGAVLHLCRGVNPVKVRTKSDTANASDLFHMLHMCHHVAAKSLQRHFFVCILQ